MSVEIRGSRRSRSGQATPEFALVAFALLVLLLGIVEISRLLSASEVLSAAARAGGRVAATTLSGARDAAVTTSVQTAAASYFAPANLSVSVSSVTDASGQPVVTVTVTGKLALLFANWIAGNTTLNGKPAMSVTRSATFRDEMVAL